MLETFVISDSDIEKFNSDGYLLVDRAISMDDLVGFKECLWSIIQIALSRYEINFSDIKEVLPVEDKCDHGFALLRKAGPDCLSFVQASISRSPEYYRLCSNPKIVSYIRQLIAPQAKNTPLYLTNNGIIFTNPNDSSNKSSSNIEIDWHKDTFFTLPKSHFLHIWMPLLHDATEDIGALQVCPGSHKEGVGVQQIHPEAPYDHRYGINSDIIKKFHPISINVRLGQALIFDGHLLHASGKNVSNHVRCTLIGLHHAVSNPNFEPLAVSYGYLKQTPESYFYELFKDEKALPLIDEQAISK